jgi:Flp pilus assembly protein TadG
MRMNGEITMNLPHSERRDSSTKARAENLTGTRRRKGFLIARVRAVFGSNTDGSALVEFAVTLPPIMLLMTGIFTFSTALYQKLAMTEAVSSGGRVLAVDRGDTDPCKTAAAAIYAAAPTLSASNLTLTFSLNGVSTGASCPGPLSGPNANMVSGGTAEVTASYKCSVRYYGVNYPGCSLNTQLTENVQ